MNQQKTLLKQRTPKGKSMKKTLSLLAVLLFAGTLTQAQTDTEFQKFRMGFKASPNVSWMQPRDRHFINEGAGARFGFGFIADIFFAQNYAIGTGVNIMRNGGNLSYFELERFDSEELIFRRTRSYSNQYVEIPFTFKLRTNEIGYITYWAQFGFGAGININARGDDEKNYLLKLDGDDGWVETDRASSFQESSNFSDDIRLFRASMIIALGIEYSLSGTTSLLVGATYNNGLTNSMARTNAIRSDERDNPVFDRRRDDPNSKPLTVRLDAIANSIELNIGILF